MIQKTGDCKNVIITGGGLAGLIFAIHFLKSGHSVTVIEKNTYPHHKVCGEYISNEVLPYLKWLDIDLSKLQPTRITRLQLSSNKGNTISCDLPLGGFGISRFTLDHFLYEIARQKGCKVITDTVNNISYHNDEFLVNTNSSGIFKAKLVIGAYGKRSLIDQKLSRNFIQNRSPWLAIKAHYKGDFPDDLVALHNFKGGYCGVSKVENDTINICYLTDYLTFKTFKNFQTFQTAILYHNPKLKQILENCIPLFEEPLTISQVSFEKKEPVYDHIIMIGDTAGLIHPLCGNGMAMAIHSAKIAAELSISYLTGAIKTRAEFEQQYIKAWNNNFKSRLATGKLLSRMIKKEKVFEPLLNLLIKFPSVLPLIIKKTHGKPIC